MKIRTLNIGQVNAVHGPVEFNCYGLSSCIALFLSDPNARVHGGAHLFVSKTSGPYPGAEETVDQLLAAMKKLGSSLKHVRAKLTGGAGISASVGNRNIEALMPILKQRKIYVAAADVGGALSRTVSFNSIDQEVNIINSNRIRYTI